MASRLRQRKVSVCFACDRLGPGRKLADVDRDGDKHKRSPP
jgi:hypothetical protein